MTNEKQVLPAEDVCLAIFNACIEKLDKELSFLDPPDTNLSPTLEGSCQEQSSPPGQPWRGPGSGEPAMAPQ